MQDSRVSRSPGRNRGIAGLLKWIGMAGSWWERSCLRKVGCELPWSTSYGREVLSLDTYESRYRRDGAQEHIIVLVSRGFLKSSYLQFCSFVLCIGNSLIKQALALYVQGLENPAAYRRSMAINTQANTSLMLSLNQEVTRRTHRWVGSYAVSSCLL